MASREDVNIKVSSDVAEAIRMWRAMEEGPKAMANEIENFGRKGTRAASEMERAFGGLVGQWATLAGKIAIAQQALQAFFGAQQQAQQITRTATKDVDAKSRAFAVQGGLSGQQIDEARQLILLTASERAVSPAVGFDAATQLVSSGFDPHEVTQGGALDEFLKLLSATNATGKDVNKAELAQTLVTYLKANQMAPTAGNIREAGRGIYSLFRDTNVQIGGFKTFAPKAAGIAGATGLSHQEVATLFSQFLDVTSEERGGTAFEKSVLALRTAANYTAQAAALRSIGIDPTEVDFEGETFFDVQRRLTKGLQSVSPAQADIAAKRIFGAEGFLARQVLFTPEGIRTTQQRLGSQVTDAEYSRAVSLTEGSLGARANVAESMEASAYFDPSFVDPELLRKNFRAELKQRGYSDFSIWARDKNLDWQNYFLGFTPKTATNYLSGLVGEETAREIVNNSRPQAIPGSSNGHTQQPIEIRIQLTDQDGIAIPHKSDVSGLDRGGE